MSIPSQLGQDRAAAVRRRVRISNRAQPLPVLGGVGLAPPGETLRRYPPVRVGVVRALGVATYKRSATPPNPVSARAPVTGAGRPAVLTSRGRFDDLA